MLGGQKWPSHLDTPSSKRLDSLFKGIVSSVAFFFLAPLFALSPVYTVENETWGDWMWNQREPYINQGWVKSCFQKTICAATIQVQYIQFLVTVQLYKLPSIATLTSLLSSSKSFSLHVFSYMHRRWIACPRLNKNASNVHHRVGTSWLWPSVERHTVCPKSRRGELFLSTKLLYVDMCP